MGITHTDDADWALTAHSVDGNVFTRYPIGPTTIAQGRVWFFVAGALMLHTLMWQGEVYGELLRLGSYALFVALFHVTVRAFFDARIALLATTFAVALAMVRWDGSILTTYPLIAWPFACALCAALLAGRHYVLRAKPWAAALAAGLIFLSFMNNEGMTALFMALGLLAARHQAVHDRRRARRLLIATLLACAAYGALYAAWRWFHPSTYGGHNLAAFSIRSFLLTFLHFSTGGNVVHDLFWPYQVRYANVQDAVGVTNTYGLQDAWPGALRDLPAMVAGLAVAILTLRALGRRKPQFEGSRGVHGGAIVAGLLIASVPLMPVSASAMYQDWVMQKGIRAYSHTALAHFGWSLVAAAACAGWVSRSANRTGAAVVVAVVAGLLAAVTSFTNDRIVDDMRTEAGRWRVLDHVLALNRQGPRAPAIVVPRLANGSWYTVVAPTYWSEWTKARYGDDTSVLTWAKEPVPDAWLVDYAFDLRSRSFVGLMAATPGASQVRVFSEAAEPGGLELLATDAAGRTSRHPLGLPMRDGRLSTWVVQVPAAVTVRLEGAALDSRRRVLGLDLAARRVLN